MSFGAPFPGIEPVRIAFQSSASENAAAASSKTFLALTLGADDPGRRIVIGIHWAGATTISSATIAGVSTATLIQHKATRSTGFISAIIPTGATGDVVLNFSGNSSQVAISVYRVTGWGGTAISSTFSDAMPSSFVLSSIPDGGAAVAFVGATDNVTTDPTASATWTELMEDIDASYGSGGPIYFTSASKEYASGSSPTATCTHTHTGTSQTGVALVLGNT